VTDYTFGQSHVSTFGVIVCFCVVRHDERRRHTDVFVEDGRRFEDTRIKIEHVAGIWFRNGLSHLVETFNYVTYNGRRISESDALAADLAKRGRAAV